MSTSTGHLIESAEGVSLAEVGESAEGADVKSMPVSVNGLFAELLEELAALAAERTAEGGLRLMGEGGILPELAQHLMQAALEAEMDQHLAAGAGRAGGRGSRSGGNTRNGYRAKKVSHNGSRPGHRAGPPGPSGHLQPEAAAEVRAADRRTGRNGAF
jgi:hypothetical protein